MHFFSIFSIFSRTHHIVGKSFIKRIMLLMGGIVFCIIRLVFVREKQLRHVSVHNILTGG